MVLLFGVNQGLFKGLCFIKPSVKICIIIAKRFIINTLECMNFLKSVVTELGMVKLVRPLHSENAATPMLVTELGMVTLVRPLQPENILNIDNQQLIR